MKTFHKALCHMKKSDLIGLKYKTCLISIVFTTIKSVVVFFSAMNAEKDTDIRIVL